MSGSWPVRSPRPVPDTAGPGQESVWDYPRPPRLDTVSRSVRVELGGIVVAEATTALRVLETSHPPTYYLPPDTVDMARLSPRPGTSWCEWKGHALYWTVRVGDVVAERAAWSYPEPTAAFGALAEHVAFYPALVDCFVDDVPVVPQPGGFYGGWITPDVVGPFKGVPGSAGW